VESLSGLHTSRLHEYFHDEKQMVHTIKMPPNKSPEPTAVGAGRSAIAVHAASRRWLSFLR